MPRRKTIKRNSKKNPKPIPSKELALIESHLPIIFKAACLAIYEAGIGGPMLLTDPKTKRFLKRIIDDSRDYFDDMRSSTGLYQEKYLIQDLLSLFKKTKEPSFKMELCRQDVINVLSKHLIEPTEEKIDLVKKQMDPKSKFSTNEIASLGPTKEGAMLLATLLIQGPTKIRTPRRKYDQLKALNESDLCKLAMRWGLMTTEGMLQAKYRLFKGMGISEEALAVIKKDDQRMGHPNVIEKGKSKFS